MDVEWVAISPGDVAWIALSFVLGLLAVLVRLPPLVGFLLAGFLLGLFGLGETQTLSRLADIGITLLLFTVGLKMRLGTLARPQVWAVSLVHMALIVGLIGLALWGLASTGLPLIGELDLTTSLLVAFALSFSSTVFAVKVLEAHGTITSLHGRITIGILLMQDVAAVLFLALTSGKYPSWWALGLVLLPLLRPLLNRLLDATGHGELLVLYGLLLALGGAELFELLGLKGDLGALVVGLLIAPHPRAGEMGKALLGFKDLFLLGFFLSVGMAGPSVSGAWLIGLSLLPLLLLKSLLWYVLLAVSGLRARTSTLATLNLSNYSEFGLIVTAVGVSAGWLSEGWLIAIAVALAASFSAGSVASDRADALFARLRGVLRRLERREFVHDDQLIDLGGARVAVIGMGRVGAGTYDSMRERFGEAVVGVDIDPVTVATQGEKGRHVLLGDPSDGDFWDRVQASHRLELVMITLPKVQEVGAIVAQLRGAGYSGPVACTARFPDQEEELRRYGATTVFNIYREAGAGFAAHVAADVQ